MKKLFDPQPFENPKGFGFTFLANETVSYYLLFNRMENIYAEQKLSPVITSSQCYLMEFSHTEGHVSPASTMAGHTICMILQQFLVERPNAVIFGVYDDTKVSDRARHRLLDIWFKRYNTESMYRKMDIITSRPDKQEVVSILFKADNTAFTRFLK